jgi:hypothetical protein
MYFGFAFFNNIPISKIFKKESYKGISALRIIGAIGAGMALSASAIGILFKMQSYPGADADIAAGLFTCFIVAGISIIKFTKIKAPYYGKILKRVLIYGAICLTWFVIPKTTWIEFKYRDRPAYVRALERSWANPNSKALRDSVEMEWDKATNPK